MAELGRLKEKKLMPTSTLFSYNMRTTLWNATTLVITTIGKHILVVLYQGFWESN